MGWVIAAVAAIVGAVLFLVAAALSYVTSAGDRMTWGWRTFEKLGILNLLEASRRRAAERNERRRNQN